MGLIIIGYPGIGKSTLASKDPKYVDLESSCFHVDGRRVPGWYSCYAKLAIHIAQQGHIVFISSHKIVRDYLMGMPLPMDVQVAVCYPDMQLHRQWVDKLRLRYESTQLEKDYSAYMQAKQHYGDDISSMSSFTCPRIVICNIDYDLKTLIEEAFPNGR